MSRKGLTEDVLKLAAEVSVSGDMPPKPCEPVRLAIDTIRSLLAPLEEADRNEVMIALELENAQMLSVYAKQLDEARETTEEFRRHNEQRMEQVEEARKIINAQPNETLPGAILRWRHLTPLKWLSRCTYICPNGKQCEGEQHDEKFAHWTSEMFTTVNGCPL